MSAIRVQESHGWAAAILLAMALVAACGKQSAPPPAGPAGAKAQPRPVAAKPTPKPPKESTEPWFVDEAAQRGIDMLNQTGYPGKKEMIMGGVGPGSAVLDVNGDGRLDIYLPNGNWLSGPQRQQLYTGEDRPRNALYVQQPDGTFRNEAKERGVDDDSWSFGCAAIDIDSDGDDDLIVTNLGPNRFYINDGTGHFTDIAPETGLAGPKEKNKWEWSTGIGLGDYDRDGILDVYISNYADLFKWLRTNSDVKRDNDGSIKPGGAAVCDWQRIKVYCGPMGLPGVQDHLFHGLGGKDRKIRFEDVTKASGIWRPPTPTGPLYGFTVLFADLNEDGWPDIFVANDSAPSFHFENQKDGTFKEVAHEYGIALGAAGDDMAGMGCCIGDLNGDGRLDILKTNFSMQTNNLYLADFYKGRTSFRDVSIRAGVKQEVYTDLSWTVLYFDYDLDGRRDIFFSCGHVYPEVDLPAARGLNTSFNQYNRMFRNESTGKRMRFRSVEKDLGPGFQVKACSRGGSLFDVDNDGDMDLFVVNLNGKPNLLINKRGNKNGHWLMLRFVGNLAKKVPLDPIGTRFTVKAGKLVQFFDHERAYGFLSTHDPRQNVGLGSYTGPVTVEVTWPNGDHSVHNIPGVNREVEIRQP